MGTPFLQLIQGLQIPLLGFKKILSSKDLFLLSAIPFVVGLLTLFFGFFLISDIHLNNMVVGLGLLFDVASFWSFLNPIINFFAWILLLTAYIVCAYLLVNILCAPIFSLISEKILVKEGVKEKMSLGLKGWAALTVRMLVISLKKIAFFALISLCLFPMTFLGLQFVATTGMLLMLAFDLFDYSFEALEWDLKQRMNFFRKYFAKFVGLAISCLAVNIVPGLFFVVLPTFVVGVAFQFSDFKERGGTVERRHP